MSGRFPFYQQLDAMDCGATCLRMVSRHFGRYYSLEYLRDLTYMGKQGVTLLGISDAAEHIGLQSLAVKTTFDRLARDIPVPAVAHWKQEHFVVVYKANSRHVWIADPAAGKFKLTREEFLENWASDVEDGEDVGVLLLLEPTPEFYAREGEKINKSGFGYVRSYFQRYRPLLLQLGVGLALGSLLQLIFPFLIKSIIDTGIENDDLNFIQLILLAQFFLFATMMAVEQFRSWILLHVTVRVNISLISDFLIKLTKLPISFFDSKVTGDLMQRIADHERVQRFLTSTSLVSIFTFANILVFAGVLLAWDATIFGIFIVFTLAQIGWIFYFQYLRRELDYKHFDQSAENQSNLMELISGMQDIKLHNAEKQKRWAWERIQARLFRTSVSALRIGQIQRAGSGFFNETKNLLIIFMVAKAVMDNEMSLGMLLGVQYIIGQMNSPLNQLFEFLRARQEAKISLERLNEIHVRDNEENLEEKITILPEYGDLILENVSFQYNGPHSPTVLRSVNLRIPKGQTTAIVGTSGSGKTTILKLLLNIYQPTEGAIRLGDINLSNVNNRLWRNKCGVVMQDGYIFFDSIARNIALGDEIIDKRKLLNAVKVANIQTFIESLPLGYNTKIGQEGLGLSQGQRQRMLIARAVYKNPDYIFFDEATTALDAYNEMLIMENLEDFFRGRTVVTVAHRLSTVMNADNIIVLEGGEIVEQGTHDELTYLRGAYYQLVRNQLELGA
ncbi:MULTISPECIES: peptidase domain-containing ABC transporter [Phaeodactylibacter]|jgi:ATP-binding cassette subfamily B protein|uniref:ABC transporter ATP-binding protein n=1 Tax=Phaeodactylibacter xiamenensis TaxID=1524460 RepID=A0A098S238_9BACT|nr:MULTISPECIES: peptidase domain-containing ABC transporter [Phaeodactylibacter]KGE86156.1 ABC transporter ATP-binding protein [Phaeodactylibacter xiamenensis]MCI4649318.1 peptidase domain-containing ABC transporter [Phaeodactylibacter sp.]MCI5090641.1 peptidase domain-containing ABC transporter [Phaeodactylibacter sp.]MCR9052135.1 peptidase domain-containing ABC transporter [bacterium]